MDINTLIANRLAYTGADELTYYNQTLYEEWAKNSHDPYILFKIKIWGRYGPLFGWSPTECEDFIKDNLKESICHYVGDQRYDYDWGKGENKITDNKMHEPHLDHKIPKARYYELYPNGNCDEPSNLRIVCARVNFNKGDTLGDAETVASILDFLNLLDDKEKWLPVIEKRISELK